MYKNYHHQLPIQIRFADLDAMNHVNNANFLTYVELGRIGYFKDMSGVEMGALNEGIILAKATIDFKLPILLGDDVFIFTRCSRIGGKSFDLEYEIAKKTADGYVTMATCTSVQVCFDYTTGKTIAVPELWKRKVIEFEGAENIQMS